MELNLISFIYDFLDKFLLISFLFSIIATLSLFLLLIMTINHIYDS